jgi:uncharacterized protein YdeI (BOF family)
MTKRARMTAAALLLCSTAALAQGSGGTSGGANRVNRHYSGPVVQPKP